MNFEWSPKKAHENEAKHGVAFDEAIDVFSDELSSTVSDPDHSIGEARYLIFGRTRQDQYLVVGFTERSDRIRIINARQLTRQERKAYEQ